MHLLLCVIVVGTSDRSMRNNHLKLIYFKKITVQSPNTLVRQEKIILVHLIMGLVGDFQFIQYRVFRFLTPLAFLLNLISYNLLPFIKRRYEQQVDGGALIQFSYIQFYLYNGNSQQQLPWDFLYGKVKTLQQWVWQLRKCTLEKGLKTLQTFAMKNIFSLSLPNPGLILGKYYMQYLKKTWIYVM